VALQVLHLQLQNVLELAIKTDRAFPQIAGNDV
jgi:hypothetical protein